MSLRAARRPLGPLKTLLRQNRQQSLLLRRTLATETTPPADAAIPPTALPTRQPKKIHTIRSNIPDKPIRSAFAVYAGPASIRETNPAALEAFHAQQIQRLDRTGARTALLARTNRDAARVGDVLQVTLARGGGEPFAGVLLAIRRAGVDTAVLLRNTLLKTGVEMWFKIYSPAVAGVEVVWRRPKRARRARLTYMRQPRHDMGNVEHLVDAWRRTRHVFSSRGGRGAKGGKGAKGSTTSQKKSKHK